MDTLIVQSGVKHGRVAEITRSRDGRLSIGRGYDNDLVLTDPHVAPRQVEFVRDGEAWYMRVLDRTNPVFLNDRKVVDDTAAVQSGDRLTLGRTRLTLCGADSPVDRTRKLVLANWLATDSGSAFTPAVVLLVACLLDLVLTYAEGSTTLRWGEVAYGELIAAVIVVVWAGIWSTVGRILSHQHHFGLQLMAASGVLLLTTVLVLGSEYLAYPFHDPEVTEAFGWIAGFILLAVLFHLNLLIATHMLHSRAIAAGMSALVLVVLYGFGWLTESDNEELALLPAYSSTLVPAPLAAASGRSTDEYFATLRERVDKSLRQD